MCGLKGTWKHTAVAIKRLGVALGADGRVAERAAASSAAAGDAWRQSLAELKALALCRHDNILPLYGYCLRPRRCCVVYQFMAGGSLDERLFGPKAPAWSVL